MNAIDKLVEEHFGGDNSKESLWVAIERYKEAYSESMRQLSRCEQDAEDARLKYVEAFNKWNNSGEP